MTFSITLVSFSSPLKWREEIAAFRLAIQTQRPAVTTQRVVIGQLPALHPSIENSEMNIMYSRHYLAMRVMVSFAIDDRNTLENYEVVWIENLINIESPS